MVTLAELSALLREGENSGVEFKDVMRDYGYLEHGYLEHMVLGVPRKIVRGTQEFNGSIPEFIVGEESLTVVLRR